jgi:two-component system, NarL family, invasion response regulator UvrY
MKILFVFGSQLLLEGINSILNKLYRNVTTIHTSSVQDLEFQLKSTKWDLVIVDADQGAIFIEKILQLFKHSSSALQTIFMYEVLTQKGLMAYRMGLKGSFSKSDSKENIELAFKTVLSGQVYVPQSLILNIICDGHVFTNLEHQIGLLSNKEKELLSYLSLGKRMKEITQLMNLAPSTLSTHKHRIMQKIRLHSNQEFNSFLKAYAESFR